MLSLILGTAGSGKTGRIMAGLKDHALAGGKALFLVPEQFSSTAESLVYRELGDADSAFVEVVSFRTLSERILDACGGGMLPVMTDAGRAVFVRRALDALAGRLHTFARQRRDAAFCGLCADTITELKTAGARPDDLRTIARETDDPKLAELADIFDAYEAGIAGAAMDPADRIHLAATRAGEGFFAGKTCFIDNFDGFTSPEYALLRPMLATAEGVVAALCCDGLDEVDGGLGLFSPVRKTAQRLLEITRQADGVVKAPVVLSNEGHPVVPGLASVNNLLAGREEGSQQNGGLWLTQAADEWEEVRLAASEMHRLALTGVPYGRMAFVCRDMSRYESPVRRMFALYGIPLFTDQPDTIEHTAPVAFVRGTLALLRQGLGSEPLLALLKTGLVPFTNDEVSALDNYVYTWRPRAAQWRDPFEGNPGGLIGEISESGRAQLDAAEGVRETLVPLLEAFTGRAKGANAARLSREIYLLMDKLGAPEAVERLGVELELGGDFAAAERCRRAWDLCMNLLDQMNLLLGTDAISPEEYDALFLILVRSTDFGTAPQSLEAATFTGADRMRLAAPEYCFVAALAEGEFPMQVGYSGLLTHEDRERLVDHGVEMPGSFENRVLLEEMILYQALTSPSKGLYMSWPARLAGGARVMSAALEPLCEALAPPSLEATPEMLSPTPAAAFDRLCDIYREDTPEGAGLYTALRQEGGESARMLELLLDVDNTGVFSVGDTALMERLVGRSITLSPTSVDSYYSCKFKYFLERVLRVRPRKRAEVSPLEGGTFVHYILEKALGESGEVFSGLSDEELMHLCEKHADAFADTYLPEVDNRTTHLLERVKKSTGELLFYLRDDAAQSEFKVDALELPIGLGDNSVAPLEIETQSGRKIQVTGKVDRVDTYTRDGKTYLRIIDYKSSNKGMDLRELEHGVNMQLMIYMNTLCKNATEQYPQPTPAAMLYLAADQPPTASGKTPRRVKGLLLDEAEVLQAMERDGRGGYIPVLMKKDGTPSGQNKQIASRKQFKRIAEQVEELLAGMAEGVYRGGFPARPLVVGNRRPCAFCDYRSVCRHEDGRNEEQVGTGDEEGGEADG